MSVSIRLCCALSLSCALSAAATRLLAVFSGVPAVTLSSSSVLITGALFRYDKRELFVLMAADPLLSVSLWLEHENGN